MGFKFVGFLLFHFGFNSPALRTRYDGLKRFCRVPTLSTLSDPLCSYAIRLYACVFVCIVQKWCSTGSVCLYACAWIVLE